MAQNDITISGILQQLAQQYNASISERTLCERVLEQRPSQAKDPFASIRDKLRWEGSHVGWVRIGAGEVIPLRVVREGLTFRVQPADDEYHNDQLIRYRLLPFVHSYDVDIRLEDASGNPIQVKAEKPRDPNFIPAANMLKLGGWFRRSGFQQGDSILITIRSHAPLILRLEHEPAAAFRADDVLRQEQEIVESLAKAIGRSRSNLTSAEELIMPIYARADWRTGYPGRPWQQLVQNDSRLRLVDELFIASSNFRRPIDTLRNEHEWQSRDDEDNALLEQIVALQEQLRESRRMDAEHGMWNGLAKRASAAQIIFDPQEGSSTVIFLEPIDTRDNYNEQIERNLEQGGYTNSYWQDAFDDDDDDFDDFDPFDDLDDDDIAEIEDLQEFMDENPQLAEAAQKLMAALTPDEIGRLQNTDSTEEAQQILAHRLHQLLPHDPSLFGTFAPYTLDLDEPSHSDLLNGNGQINPNGTNQHELSREPHIIPEHPQFGLDWDPHVADWGDEHHAPLHGDFSATRAALERSNDLMELFYQYLRNQGKSEATATSRTGDLWVYADFLANYYGLGLGDGEYATLDECLFFFYPRKIINGTPRSVREMCTSLKQFYAFYKTTNGSDDTFAQAIWRRRDQAARVIELHEQIDIDSPQFERLFAYLFAPYTA
jgi:hypothetical protein